MPAKSKFNAEDIVNAAFAIARTEGAENCSARAIAGKLKSSTMPIYSSLNSMKDLEEAVLKKAVDLLISYGTKVWAGDAFLDMGIGYIMFAKNEKHLFRMLFLSEKGEDFGQIKKRFRDYASGALLKVLSGFEPLKDLSEEKKLVLMERMWIFIHGLAMLLNNSIIDDLDEKQVAELILDTGIFVIRGEIMREQVYGNTEVKRFLKSSGYEYLCEQKGGSVKLF